jgi:hypothetical protein
MGGQTRECARYFILMCRMDVEIIVLVKDRVLYSTKETNSGPREINHNYSSLTVVHLRTLP